MSSERRTFIGESIFSREHIEQLQGELDGLKSLVAAQSPNTNDEE